MIYSLADLIIATQTVWAEGRGESQQGREWIAHVLINRLQSKTGQWAKDDTLATVCLRHLQFSAWTAGDANFISMQKGPDLTVSVWRQCMMAVLTAMDRTSDPTGGARHYATHAADPVWARGRPYESIGGHRFYRGIS